MDKRVRTPLAEEEIKKLKTGDRVLITGTIYTARDAAHKKLVETINQDGDLPFSLKNQIVYYTGPTPAPPGEIIGSCGPTTSIRLDGLTLPLLQKGLKGMIGKGQRSPEIVKEIKRYRGIYFIAVGGCGALLATKVEKAEIIAYPELGTEAIRKLEVKEFPVIVAIDYQGNNIFKQSLC